MYIECFTVQIYGSIRIYLVYSYVNSFILISTY